MTSKFQKGFSLVELLVVIAIIGILAAVGITAYSGYTKNAKAKAALSQYSQVEAIINSELARCAVGEGTYVWGAAATPETKHTDDSVAKALEKGIEVVKGAKKDDAKAYAAAACTTWPDTKHVVDYVNKALPDSMFMTNPYNAVEDFAVVATSFQEPSSTKGRIHIWCGDDSGDKCSLNVQHKEGAFTKVTILSY